MIPGIFVISYALSSMWHSWLITPDKLTGEWPAKAIAIGRPNSRFSDPVYWLSYSPDGTKLGARFQTNLGKDPDNFTIDNRLKIWNLSSGKVLAEEKIPFQSGVFGYSGVPPTCTFARTGDAVLTAAPVVERIHIHPNTERSIFFDIARPSYLKPMEFRPAYGIWRLEKDDSIVVIEWLREESKIVFHRFANGKKEQWDVDLHRSGVGPNTISLSSDGKHVAVSFETYRESGLRGEHCLEIWNVGKEKNAIRLTGHEGPTSIVQFSPDGTKLATGSMDGTVKIWETSTGKELGSFVLQARTISSLSFTPSGSRLACASMQTGNRPNLHIIDIEKLAITHRHQSDRSHFQITFDPSGKQLATIGQDDVIRIWDVSKFAPYKTK